MGSREGRRPLCNLEGESKTMHWVRIISEPWAKSWSSGMHITPGGGGEPHSLACRSPSNAEKKFPNSLEK